MLVITSIFFFFSNALLLLIYYFKDKHIRTDPRNEEVKIKEANRIGVELKKKSNCDIPDEAQRRDGGREDDSFHNVPSQSSAEASADETRISDDT